MNWAAKTNQFPLPGKTSSPKTSGGIHSAILFMNMLRVPRTIVWTTAGAFVLLLSLAVIISKNEAKRRLAFTETSATARRRSLLPPVILWAWERPENLDFIDPEKTGIAFLAKTLYLRADKVIVRPRLQPLNVPQGTKLIAVARVESDRGAPPSLSSAQNREALAEISRLARLPNIIGVQVDFDAAASERDFYRSLLVELRKQLPASTALAITALASWCKGDNWLDDLPVDEAIPMLFRMGVERKQILSQLENGGKFSAKSCQTSAGISLDEPVKQLPPVQHVYAFNPNVWSPSSIKRLMETYQNAQQAP